MFDYTLFKLEFFFFFRLELESAFSVYSPIPRSVPGLNMANDDMFLSGS